MNTCEPVKVGLLSSMVSYTVSWQSPCHPWWGGGLLVEDHYVTGPAIRTSSWEPVPYLHLCVLVVILQCNLSIYRGH